MKTEPSRFRISVILVVEKHEFDMHIAQDKRRFMLFIFV